MTLFHTPFCACTVSSLLALDFFLHMVFPSLHSLHLFLLDSVSSPLLGHILNPLPPFALSIRWPLWPRHKVPLTSRSLHGFISFAFRNGFLSLQCLFFLVCSGRAYTSSRRRSFFLSPSSSTFEFVGSCFLAGTPYPFQQRYLFLHFAFTYDKTFGSEFPLTYR